MLVFLLIRHNNTILESPRSIGPSFKKNITNKKSQMFFFFSIKLNFVNRMNYSSFDNFSFFSCNVGNEFNVYDVNNSYMYEIIIQFRLNNRFIIR